MSKQRPSKRSSQAESKARSGANSKDTQSYWYQRLFQAGYSRNGKSHRVRFWSIKVQHQGVRRSIPLATASRTVAAERALHIYQSIRYRGWQAADETIHRLCQSSSPAVPLARKQNLGSRSQDFWKQRLFRRSYLAQAGANNSDQWSVRYEREGSSEFFPSNARTTDQAIRFAEELYRHIEKEGWQATCQKYPREFTMALFWSLDPITSTYATMLSLVEKDLKRFADGSTKNRRVLIVEPKPEIAQTICFWISQNPGFEVLAPANKLVDAKRTVAEEDCDLVLMNRQSQLSATSTLEAWQTINERGPAIIGYGLYEDSNQIFRSVSGVNHGYFFRRRNPDQLLAPVLSPESGLPFRSIVPLRVKAYFQQLFDEISHSEPASQLSLLTQRELEILEHLSAGSLDKEIAVKLRISNWTVRNHLKRIYSKLGIHNRTEAVIQYLQK